VKCHVKVSQMLLKSSRLHNNVVDVYFEQHPQQVMEDQIYCSLVCGACIFQTKGHNHALKESYKF
jgi:hypothetical protein